MILDRIELAIWRDRVRRICRQADRDWRVADRRVRALLRAIARATSDESEALMPALEEAQEARLEAARRRGRAGDQAAQEIAAAKLEHHQDMRGPSR